MRQQVQHWFADLPYSDPLKRRQALLLQGMELSIGAVAILFLLQSVLTSGGRPDLTMVLLLLLAVGCATGAVALLRDFFRERR